MYKLHIPQRHQWLGVLDQFLGEYDLVSVCVCMRVGKYVVFNFSRIHYATLLESEHSLWSIVFPYIKELIANCAFVVVMCISKSITAITCLCKEQVMKWKQRLVKLIMSWMSYQGWGNFILTYTFFFLHLCTSNTFGCSCYMLVHVKFSKQ